MKEQNKQGSISNNKQSSQKLNNQQSSSQERTASPQQKQQPQQQAQQPAAPDAGSAWSDKNSSSKGKNDLKSDLASKSRDLSSKSEKRQGSQQWDDIKPREQSSDSKSYESNRFNRADVDQKTDDMDYDVNFDTEDRGVDAESFGVDTNYDESESITGKRHTKYAESDETDNDIESKNTGGGRFQQTSNRGSVAQNYNKKNSTPGSTAKR